MAATIGTISVDLMASFAGGTPISVGVLEVPVAAELAAVSASTSSVTASATIGAWSFKTSLARSLRDAADELDGSGQ